MSSKFEGSELKFGITIRKPDIRTAFQLKCVLAYPNSLKKDFPAYYMYRDLYECEEDRKKILRYSLRYDITIIPPARIGEEYIKTYGHYHPRADGVSYTEIYEVLEGKAIYLLQKRGSKDSEIKDVVAVLAGKGDKVIVPPDYGHVTINPSNKTLKMANWVCRNFNSIYEPYKKLRGACYYYTTSGWIANKNYIAPEVKTVKPVIPEWLGISKNENMYSLVEDIDRLKFLTDPLSVDYKVFSTIASFN